jgi:PEP-CTERM motif
MRISRIITNGTIVVAAVLSVAGASQAQTITLGAAWYANQLNATTGSGLLKVVGDQINVPLSASSTNSWDIVADLGVAKTFSFTNALTATVYDNGTSVDNYFKETTVDFTGAGSTPGNVQFIQGISGFDLGTSGRFVFNNSNTVQFITKPTPGYAYLWSGKFNSSAPVTQAFVGGETSFTWPTTDMSVTLVAVIPEPATLALFGLGLAPIAVAIRRRRK